MPFTMVNLFQALDYYRKVRAYSTLAFLPNYSILGPIALLAFLPLGLLAVLFAPFPWQLFSSSQIMAAPEMIVWYALFPFLIKGVVSALKHNFKYTFPLFVYAFISFVSLGVLEGNVGTMFRHRAIALNFFLMFIAAGLNLPRKTDEA